MNCKKEFGIKFDENMNSKEIQSIKKYRTIRNHSNKQSTKQTPRKIVMVGSTKCGKTSLIHRFLDNQFTYQYKPTVEDLYNREYKYRSYNLDLDIVDMSGKFQYPVMRDLHIKTADVIMLVYEAENMQSIQEAKTLYKLIREIREDKMRIILIGTKTDLKRGSFPPGKFRESEEIRAIVKEMKGAKHILTSSRHNIHIKEAFEFALDDVIKKLHTLSMAVQQEKLNGPLGNEKWKRERKHSTLQFFCGKFQKFKN